VQKESTVTTYCTSFVNIHLQLWSVQ